MVIRSHTFASALVLSLALGCGGSSSVDPPPSSDPSGGPPLALGSKVDVLFVVDDSLGMADKSSRLASSVGGFLRFAARTNDVHVGVLSSSLGTPAGDVCPDTNPGSNDRAHLRTTGPDEKIVAGAESGVLAYTGGDVDAFVASTQALLLGVGQTGCGFEAQLETMYRFLIQPDPWQSAVRDETTLQTRLIGVDTRVISERKAFLRPDSALVVVMVTDEDDSTADPMAMNGQGWAFMRHDFPGSNIYRDGSVGRTAPRGASICETDPGSDRCTSCGYKENCNPLDPICIELRADKNCTALASADLPEQGNAGYWGSSEDSLNVRFHRMKERFGLDPQFPIARYVDGLANAVVPDRKGEHPHTGPLGVPMLADLPEYIGTPSCTNPLFASRLPASEADELCHLPKGTRSPELVLFALLGGLPPALATDAPDWTAIVGRDPGRYDLSGIDPHMIPSVSPRPGLPEDYDTKKSDLQYACTFELPLPHACTRGDANCPCADNPSLPICSGSTQTRAKAYPTHRPLRVARDLGPRAVFGSVCEPSYEPALERLRTRLASQLIAR